MSWLIKKILTDKTGKISFTKVRLINGRVLFSLTGGDLYKAEEALSPEISLRKLSFPFLVTSFSRMNKDAYGEKKYPYYTQRNSDNIRKFFKEIACQANGEYSFAYVAYNLGDKFSSGIINYHQSKFSIGIDICQGENRVICALSAVSYKL